MALAEQAAAEGAIALSWAAATPSRDHLNLGDALSPVMVALVAGRPVRHSPFRAATPRLAAAVEFVLEGLHLSNRLNKTVHEGASVYARR